MTVLSVIQDASMACGLDRPLAVFSSADREWREMQTVANEAAAQVAKMHDWQALLAQHTLIGDGLAADFPLPADYGRMLSSGSIWTSRAQWALNQVVNFDEWIEITEVWSAAPVIGNWIIYGGRMHFAPVLASGEIARFFYVSSNLAKSENGSAKPLFTDDTDRFRLSERLLKLGVIYLWKQLKGFDFAAELADFEQAVAQDMRTDRGALPTLGNRGSRRPGRNVWPGQVLP